LSLDIDELRFIELLEFEAREPIVLVCVVEKVGVLN